MLQPFEIFKPQYIPQLIHLKKSLLVAQSYGNSYDHLAEVQKIDILVTDYDDIGLAKIHLAAIKKDKYASVIDLTKEKHLQKLKEMLAPGSVYAFYWAIVKNTDDLKKKVDIKYKDHIRRWLMKNTIWRIGADETIRPQLQVIFGELFVTLKHGSQEVRIKFEEIEKS